MGTLGSRRSLAALAVAVAVVGGLAGCSKDEFADRTAVVAIGGTSQTYKVSSCGLDGQTVFVVARAPDGAVLQGVMGLKKDDKTGITESTGATVDLDPASTETRVAAFGTEAWERKGSTGPAPGSITSARLRGSRIQFAGEAVPVDANDEPTPDGKAERFSVDARCDEVDG
ncbi:hypothetical protein [Aquihabitans sp. McL0605]|uniref:hypothetical protein n=1 Tax=Aquihabitans sp. McL0605 TaxID=3415671 RepID=UPI003CE85DC6